jgi:hypothetical protein
MTKTITQENLISFLYGETSKEESSFIEEVLRSDWKLNEVYNTFLENKTLMDIGMSSPRSIIIKRILEYSASTSPQEHTL